MATENRTFGTGNQDANFVDRRIASASAASGFERRQFSDGHQNLSPEATELGSAIDQYKLQNRRKYITYEEMLSVVKSLGYCKNETK